MIRSVFRTRLRITLATLVAAITAGATTTAVVVIAEPTASALSYNPAPANVFHAPISTMGLAALNHLEAKLQKEVNDHNNGGGSTSANSASSGSIPLAGGMSSIALPPNTIRFISDSSYMSQSETTVAVDPSATSNATRTVVGGVNDSRYFFCPLFASATATAANCPSGWTQSLSGFAVSTDGGSSLATTGSDGTDTYDIPSLLAGNPHHPTFLVSWGDPGVAAAPNGLFYYSSLAISPTTSANGVELSVSNPTLTSDPASCITPLSNPTFNPCWTSTLVFGNLLPSASTFEDKPMITVDMDKTSPYYGDAYVAWDHFFSNGTSASYLARCTTTLTCTMLAGGPLPPISGTDQFAAFTTPVVDSSGNVYVTWCNFGTPTTLMPITCEIRSSGPGGTNFGAPVTVLTLDETQATGGGLDGYATEQFRTVNIPSLAVGPATAKGTPLYFVIDACTAGDYYDFLGQNVLPGNCGASKVLLSSSADGGATWSPAQDLTSGTPNAITAQPWVTVDPTSGEVYVAYYTTAYDTLYNHMVDVVLQSSTDGGSIWTATRLTTPSIEPNADPAYFDYMSTFGGAFLVPQFGDYFQATAYDGTVWTSYCATYTAELGTLQTDPYLNVTSG